MMGGKRGVRRASTERHVVRWLRQHRQMTGEPTPDWPRGTLRKGHSWLACGRPRCLLCHREKLCGVPLPRDRRRAAAAVAP